ncbi:hypothetical protein ACP4OV_008172 [Aristida adscensionis]
MDSVKGGAARGRSLSFSGISSAAAAAGGKRAGGKGGDGEAFVRAGAENDVYVRADKIDLKNLDVQLERTRSRAWLERQRSARAGAAAATATAAAPTPAPARPPLLEWEIDVAKLEIQSQVAHGTFGVVYRGTYDGRDVAVKVLDWGQEGLDSSAKHREAFEKEVAVWQKLDHPNVTKFVGALMGTSQLRIPRQQQQKPSSGVGSGAGARAAAAGGECCVVVVEFQHGGTLKTLLYNHRDRKLPYKKVVQLALDLARGLSYLHARRIVHRDVKAENMLLDRKRTLKIADFGVARVEAAAAAGEMTGQTGTLGYMAPEVLEGRPYDHKCDVYSFGILLWETYCCAMAYPNYSIADISYHVVKLVSARARRRPWRRRPAGLPAASSASPLARSLFIVWLVAAQGIRPDIPRCCPRALAEIMARCWDAKPELRPEMAEVVAMLERIDTGGGKGGMTPVDDVAQGCFCFGFPRNASS